MIRRHFLTERDVIDANVTIVYTALQLVLFFGGIKDVLVMNVSGQGIAFIVVEDTFNNGTGIWKLKFLNRVEMLDQNCNALCGLIYSAELTDNLDSKYHGNVGTVYEGSTVIYDVPQSTQIKTITFKNVDMLMDLGMFFGELSLYISIITLYPGVMLGVNAFSDFTNLNEIIFVGTKDEWDATLKHESWLPPLSVNISYFYGSE